MNEALTGERILVTGATGWVAGPLAASLAADGNEVFGAARFADPSKREPLEAAGVTTVSIDLATRTFDEIPSDLDLVLHFAVAKVPEFAAALDINGEATGDLIEHAAERERRLARRAALLVHRRLPAQRSRGAAARPIRWATTIGHRPDSRPTRSPRSPPSRFARYQARRLGIPTVIARLNVPYGDTYGWPLMHVLMMEHGMAVPVHTDAPTSFAPIHADDIHTSIPFLLALASAPATTVNWGGNEVVSVEEWCGYLGELTGLTPVFEATDATIGTVIPDLSVLDSTGFRPVGHLARRHAPAGGHVASRSLHGMTCQFSRSCRRPTGSPTSPAARRGPRSSSTSAVSRST